MIARRTKKLADAQRRNCWSVNAQRLLTPRARHGEAATGSADERTHFQSVHARHDSAFHDLFHYIVKYWA